MKANGSIPYSNNMSLAVSAVIKPSKCLIGAALGMCIGVISIGILIGLGHFGELFWPYKVGLSVLCNFFALFGVYCVLQAIKTRHIDISDIGQIRLVEYSALVSSNSEPMTPYKSEVGNIVNLTPNSTLWPHMLLLRLRQEDGLVTTVPVLPDSIDKEGFRRLSVACRWIAAHNNPSEHTNSDVC
jgi:toxin CptA